MNFSDFFYADHALHDSGKRKYVTDKGDAHNYIRGYYEKEFNSIRERPINLLEIGLAYCGSARLWRDWFVNGNIDIIEYDEKLITPVEGVNIFHGSAYEQSTLDAFKDNHYDYIIDDGPHSVESQVYAAKNWIKKLKPGGKLIIEDVTSVEDLIKSTNYRYKIFDFREITTRYDDVIFEITKNKR